MRHRTHRLMREDRQSSAAGFSLIEILVASAILVTVVVGVVGALQLYARLSSTDHDTIEATLLTEEAAEAIHVMRDMSWDDNIAPLSLDTAYRLIWDGSAYSATTTDEIIGNRYRRTFTMQEAYRNGSDDVALSGTPDPNTRRVMINVYVGSSTTPIDESEFLIHDLYGN